MLTLEALQIFVSDLRQAVDPRQLEEALRTGFLFFPCPATMGGTRSRRLTAVGPMLDPNYRRIKGLRVSQIENRWGNPGF